MDPWDAPSGRPSEASDLFGRFRGHMGEGRRGALGRPSEASDRFGRFRGHMGEGHLVGQVRQVTCLGGFMGPWDAPSGRPSEASDRFGRFHGHLGGGTWRAK